MAEQENGESFPNGADNGPAVGIITQYVKDLSFENPNAPAIFQMQVQPAFDVQFNIGTTQVADDVHEVVLKIEVRAQVESQVAYLVDLTYAGLFGLRAFPQDQLEPFLLAEAPRILFPFARRVLADAVRDGGFTPLMLEPIDFGQLYVQRAQAMAAQGTGEIGNA